MTISPPRAAPETPFPFADTEASMLFRALLDQYVHRNNSSLRKLAAELGYKQSTVLSHMASGRVPIPIERAAEFADHLNVPRATFLPAVLKQRHPDVLEAVAATVGEPYQQHHLSSSVGIQNSKMTKSQQRIVQEMLRDSYPEERWLTPAEVPLINFLRNATPEIFEHDLSAAQRRALKDAISGILS